MGQRLSRQGWSDGPYEAYPPGYTERGNQVKISPLPPLPPQKSVRFGAAPPAWEFYRNTPTWDNTVNTQYPSKFTKHPQGYGGYGGYAPPPAVMPNNQGAYYTWRR